MGELGRHPPIGLLFPLDRALSSRAMGELGRHPPRTIGLLFPLHRALSSRAMGELGRHPPIGLLFPLIEP